jgi:hypothetical protein
MTVSNTPAVSTNEQPASNQLSEMGQVLLEKQQQIIAELVQQDARMAKLQTEYSELLHNLKKERKPLEQALEHVDALLAFEGWESPHAEDTAHVNGGESGDISYIDAAVRYLAETGQPTHYMVIADILGQRDVFIPGTEPAKTLLAKLNRDKRFKRIKKRGTYALEFWRVKAAKPRSKRK